MSLELVVNFSLHSRGKKLFSLLPVLKTVPPPTDLPQLEHTEHSQNH